MLCQRPPPQQLLPYRRLALVSTFMIFKIEINNAMSSKYLMDIFYFCINVIILQNLIKKNYWQAYTLKNSRDVFTDRDQRSWREIVICIWIKLMI